ncbi:transcriptional regulator [Sphaerisporangium siamense]|uniref:DNA-binding MarR family transcriptional regulator n=1 Tax=Sphaerisporangium siamense TaxID=795645 RepID=A0A7W7GCE7_9ACTN|nr:MarR family transcriptional regulator [Sphaerisporangium siamense]MBB4705983.1 DNA-binding MarR family transcriptional regulator [Sphaerisporangium siamense]GII82622.1 transcriptional regulator [Sphaerisporangium siamense]
MDDTDVVGSWRELLARHATTWCALDRELHDKHDLGVSDFEVLDRMSESEHGKYRVQELADAVHLSQSALSRLISRLEKAGLVCRNMCPDDRRGVFVQITEDGRRRHAEALPTHRAVLSQRLAKDPAAL